MLITLNGLKSEAADNTSLMDLLSARAINPKLVIVELNGQIIRTEDGSVTQLKQNDRLEIIQIIGGG
jgi:sulfur carrier protein